MLKFMGAVRRLDHISHDELVHAWEHIHAPHVVSLVKPERYRITFFDPPSDSANADSRPPDGMAELWFRDREHFETTIGRQAPPNIDADKFSTYATIQPGCNLFVTEHLNVDGPTTRDTTKLTFFIKRRQGIERAHLDDYWLNVHVPNVVAAINNTPDAVRYSVDLVDLDDAERERAYDGVAQICIDHPNATFADIQGYEPDGFGELVEPMLVCSGYEVRIVG